MRMYFPYFIIISPWKRVGPFIWRNLMLCAKFGLKLAHWFWRRRFFLNSPMNFRCSLIISPCKKGGPFIWTNLNPLYTRMLCAKFSLNWPSGSGEENCLISSMYFRYFVILSPLIRAGASFEQTWIPYTQGCFVPSLVEIGPVFLEKKM